MALEAGRPSLAGGALLLYVTNLSAIVVAGVVVFVITGFAPPRRLATKARRVVAGTAAAVGLLTAVAIPLTLASFGAADRARERQAIEEAVRDWLVGTGDQVDDIELNGHQLTVRVIGVTEPPPTSDLEQRVRAILSPDAVVAVGWTQEHLIKTAQDEPTPQDLLDDDIRQAIDTWLTSGGVSAYDIIRLDITTTSIRVDITSAEAPPTINELTRRLHDELEFEPELEVNWTPRTPVRSDDGASITDIEAALTRVVREWAPSQHTEALRVTFDGATITIDLAGTSRPDGRDLEQLLRQGLTEAGIDPDDITIQVWFSSRESVVPAPTPTPTPQPTATPTPTSAPTPTPEPAGDPTATPT